MVVDDTAVLTAIAHDEYERDGEPGAHDMRLTLTWIRAADGAWTALAEHGAGGLTVAYSRDPIGPHPFRRTGRYPAYATARSIRQGSGRG